MSGLIEIFIIAVAQGIGEFLPISSSGHNAVLDHLFERFGTPLTGDSAEFVKLNILLHVGSLIAVLFVFRQRIIDMLSQDRRLILMLTAATIPGGAVGLCVKMFALWILKDMFIISGCFLVTGLLLLCTLSLPEGKKTTSTMTWLDAVIIGCVQAAAILPGLSRSGSTIVAGLFCKLKREEAAAFSFILSIPIIILGGLADCKEMFDATPAGNLTNGLLLLGASVSCIVGIVSLLFLLNWINKGKLWYFAVWVFIMSPISLALAILPMGYKDGATPPAPANVESVTLFTSAGADDAAQRLMSCQLYRNAHRLDEASRFGDALPCLIECCSVRHTRSYNRQAQCDVDRPIHSQQFESDMSLIVKHCRYRIIFSRPCVEHNRVCRLWSFDV